MEAKIHQNIQALKIHVVHNKSGCESSLKGEEKKKPHIIVLLSFYFHLTQCIHTCGTNIDIYSKDQKPLLISNYFILHFNLLSS